MARNTRTFSVKEYSVHYAVALNGKLEERHTIASSNSPRKIIKMLSSGNNVDPANIIIINVTESTTEYRVFDVVAALKKLAELGLAEEVAPVEE